MTSAPIYQKLHKALLLIEKWREENLTIAFTNGCFDILHRGHINYLLQSKSAADKLVVGLNTDDSVKAIKGDTRPIQDEGSRARVLAAMRCVDLVVFFGENTPLEIIEKIRPDIIIKGGDYVESEMIGYDYVKAYGGKTLILPFEDGYSTSRIIEKIKRN